MSLDTITPDTAMQALVDGVLAPHRAELEHRVGQTDIALNRDTMLEATMDNLLLAAVAEAAGTEIAFSNGWRYGAPVPAGPISMTDLWNIIPGNPPVSVADLTGRELHAMLEENIERTFAADPYAQMGGYLKRGWGITVRAKLENPTGTRIEGIAVGDDTLEPERVYRVAFVTAQGVPTKDGDNRRDLPIQAVPALHDYVERRDSVRPELRGAFLPV